jgi:hypothetical protein
MASHFSLVPEARNSHGDDVMKANRLTCALALSLVVGTVSAQDRAQAAQGQGEASRGREPPQQAYDDCKGKKAGDAIKHTTPEGKVDATCAESPKGLVARPIRPKGTEQGARTQQR